MDKISDNYSKRNIEKIKKSSSPKVLLNVCTHGNERVGLKIAKYFRKNYPNRNWLNGTFVINIANKKAVLAKKRFLEKDLNRVFPGKSIGSYEERLAYTMRPFIESFDFVIDIHSTETGINSTLILDNFNKNILPIITTVSPKRVLIMNATKSNSLISVAKSAIAFEYGKDASKKTYEETVKGIKRILHYFNMITLPQRSLAVKTKTEFYDVFKSVPKPEGFIVSKKIKNFKMIKKGQLIGYNMTTNKKILARSIFYPIVFGKNTYNNIFGFAARKINIYLEYKRIISDLKNCS